jgi:hypothetical protein
MANMSAVKEHSLPCNQNGLPCRQIWLCEWIEHVLELRDIVLFPQQAKTQLERKWRKLWGTTAPRLPTKYIENESGLVHSLHWDIDNVSKY